MRPSSAIVVPGNFGEPQINFTLNDEGTAIFGQVTRENVGHRLAIVLDGVLYSAPNIQSPIETGHGQITGSFDRREAFELASVLENLATFCAEAAANWRPASAVSR